MTDDARWFDSLGKCAACPKPATGILRGSQNQSMGRYCKKCADKRLARAKLDAAQRDYLAPERRPRPPRTDIAANCANYDPDKLTCQTCGAQHQGMEVHPQHPCAYFRSRPSVGGLTPVERQDP